MISQIAAGGDQHGIGAVEIASAWPRAAVIARPKDLR